MGWSGASVNTPSTLVLTDVDTLPLDLVGVAKVDSVQRSGVPDCRLNAEYSQGEVASNSPDL